MVLLLRRRRQESQVWEITGAEFSKSDIHTADGISIRFPRVTKIRHDKDWKTATDLPRLKVNTFITYLQRLKVSNSNRFTQTWDECLQITLLDKNYSLWILATWLRTDKLIMCWQISIIEITVLSYLMTQTFFKVKCNNKYCITEKLKWHILLWGLKFNINQDNISKPKLPDDLGSTNARERCKDVQCSTVKYTRGEFSDCVTDIYQWP